MDRCRSSTLRLMRSNLEVPPYLPFGFQVAYTTLRGCYGLAPLHPLPDCILDVSGRMLEGLSCLFAVVTSRKLPLPAGFGHYCPHPVRIFTASQ